MFSMEKFSVGDRVYANYLGPDAKGIITNITYNDEGQEMIEMKLDVPIQNCKGYSRFFSHI